MAAAEKRIVVGATGASGIPILVKCLELIREAEGFSSDLILSEGAKLTMEYETAFTVSEVEALADRVWRPEEIGAGPASGTYRTQGMVIVPCSMKTLAGVCSGYADNLLLRSADVTMKEHRPLVLCVRESPLSPIHLRNMHELSLIPNVRIIPPMMTFYIQPKTVDDMVFHTAARLLEPFGVETKGVQRWTGTAQKGRQHENQ